MTSYTNTYNRGVLWCIFTNCSSIDRPKQYTGMRKGSSRRRDLFAK